MTEQTAILPHNQDAEQGLLGALLIDNNAYDRAATVLKTEHFFMPAHQRIFEEISARINKGQSASPITLKTTFADDPDLKEVGGAKYLADLAGSVVSVVNVEDYCRTLKELWTRRQLVSMCDKILLKARDYSLENTGNALAEAERLLTELSDDSPGTSLTASQAVDRAMEWMENVRSGKIKPISTGITVLDNAIGGLYGAGLYIIAGRPGMGKTALALNMADNISPHHPTLVVSLEMRAEELAMRLLADRTGIPVGKQRQAVNLDMEEWQRLQEARAKIDSQNLTIEDCAGANIAAIKSKARRHKRLHGKFVLFIDYLGLIDTDRSINNKVHQIEELTKSLKGLAKELDIPVILLSQLSRAVESRDDKRPLKSDLRDSGSIEQDADVILFPYRQEYYLSKARPEKKANEGEAKYTERVADWENDCAGVKGKAEIIIGKNRQGEERSVALKFDGERQRFS